MIIIDYIGLIPSMGFFYLAYLGEYLEHKNAGFSGDSL